MCQELLTFCEKRENVFPLITQNQEILSFLEPPKRKLTHAGIVVGRKRDIPLSFMLIFKGSYHFFNERKLLEQSLRTNTQIDSLTFRLSACPQLPTLCFGLLQVY